jgi:hypothetical protein
LLAELAVAAADRAMFHTRNSGCAAAVEPAFKAFLVAGFR